MPGILTLSVQTAGYSSKAVQEIWIEGMEHAGALRELIRSLVRQPGSGSDGTGGAPARVTAISVTKDQKILDELVKIRQLLEVQRKKKDYFFSAGSAGAFTGSFPFLQR
jgi:hypothetical protein